MIDRSLPGKKVLLPARGVDPFVPADLDRKSIDRK